MFHIFLASQSFRNKYSKGILKLIIHIMTIHRKFKRTRVRGRTTPNSSSQKCRIAWQRRATNCFNSSYCRSSNKNVSLFEQEKSKHKFSLESVARVGYYVLLALLALKVHGIV